MRSAECGVRRSAECGVRGAECGVRSAGCGVRSAGCGVRGAECGVRSAECGVRSAECGVRVAGCGLRGTWYQGSIVPTRSYISSESRPRRARASAHLYVQMALCYEEGVIPREKYPFKSSFS